MYTKEMAEMLKEDAGKKWRPSNGTEGEIFLSRVCGTCKKGRPPCAIAEKTFYFNVDAPEYPAEWQINEEGQPTCTAWDSKE